MSAKTPRPDPGNAGLSVKGPWHHKCCLVYQEDVIMGYLLAWLLGVPASILILIFLIRAL